MWGIKTTTIPVMIGALGLIKKGMDKYSQKSWWYQNSRTAEDHTAWNVPHLKKGTIHQVDFNLALTLGLRSGLARLWRPINNNNNNNNNTTNNNNDNNNNNNNNNLNCKTRLFHRKRYKPVLSTTAFAFQSLNASNFLGSFCYFRDIYPLIVMVRHSTHPLAGDFFYSSISLCFDCDEKHVFGHPCKFEN